MSNVWIKGTGSYAPENIVTNNFFEKVGSSDEWIQKYLGIKERRISINESTSDLASKAAILALKNANLSPEEIDLIIVATATPDKQAPSCACFVQETIKAKNAIAFDISAVCSGALFAISTAYHYLKSSSYTNVLVIGADTFSKITDWERKDSVFFGDGAGAIILSKTEEDKGFIDFILHSDGTGKEHFTIPSATSKEEKHVFSMNGKAVFETATKVVPECIQEILQKNNYNINEVDFMVPHQPSIRILESIAEQVGMPFKKVLTNMDRYANTSGGTIPIVLDENHQKGVFKKGDLLLFAAVGAGWTWGTALYKW